MKAKIKGKSTKNGTPPAIQTLPEVGNAFTRKNKNKNEAISPNTE